MVIKEVSSQMVRTLSEDSDAYTWVAAVVGSIDASTTGVTIDGVTLYDPTKPLA